MYRDADSPSTLAPYRPDSHTFGLAPRLPLPGVPWRALALLVNPRSAVAGIETKGSDGRQATSIAF
jgi:hypothetical protein